MHHIYPLTPHHCSLCFPAVSVNLAQPAAALQSQKALASPAPQHKTVCISLH